MTLEDWVKIIYSLIEVNRKTGEITFKGDEKMLTEKRLEEVMREEAERILSLYEEEHAVELDWKFKKHYIQSAIENVDPDEVNLTLSEARILYRDWLESTKDEIK